MVIFLLGLFTGIGIGFLSSDREIRKLREDLERERVTAFLARDALRKALEGYQCKSSED